jgi:subtilase family serine protease
MRSITARIANVGGLPAKNVDVVIRKNFLNGEPLCTFNIAELEPDTFEDVWYVWDIVGEDFNEVELPIYVLTDPQNTIAEADEENNILPSLVQVGKPEDFTDEGIIDFADFAKFANFWQSVCSETQWCDGSDFNHSGSVSLDDLAEFVQDWLWQAEWYGGL